MRPDTKLDTVVRELRKVIVNARIKKYVRVFSDAIPIATPTIVSGVVDVVGRDMGSLRVSLTAVYVATIHLYFVW